MWPDRVSNPGPPTYDSGALPTALRGPANFRSRMKPLNSGFHIEPSLDIKIAK